MSIKKGDLIRWIVDYEIYEADGEQVTPASPIYAYGIIMDVSSQDSKNAVVCRLNNDGSHIILHLIHDGFEVISEAKTNKIP